MRVLVIEDEVDLASAIRDGLNDEGYEVEVANDGEEGLWRAREGSYAAIVLDLMLPKVNGFAVCKTLREEGDWTPILMLTAKDGEWDQAEGLDTGADDYLTKPFSLVVLAARIRALQRRAGIPRPVVIEAGDLRLDPAARTCRRGDRDIALTAREFALLECLMRRSGQIVPRRELLDRVWGRDFEGDPGVLDVYIGYLRNKIDRPFARDSLKTGRGVGYGLVNDES